MDPRLFLAALAAAFLFIASPPTLGPTPARAEAAMKEKTKKPPSAKQTAARELTRKCSADWREHKKTAQDKKLAAYRAFMKACRAKK